MRKKADIITGAVVGVVALIAPIGYVMVEATTKSAKQPKVLIKERSDRPLNTVVDPPTLTSTAAAAATQVAIATNPAAVLTAPLLTPQPPVESASVPSTVTLEPAQSIASRRADWFAGQGRTVPATTFNEPLDADHEDPVGPRVSESMRTALAEVGLSSKTTDTVVEPPSADELAQADLAQELGPVTEPSSDELSEEDRRIAAEFDQQVATVKAHVVTVTQKTVTVDSKLDDASRSKITIVRPRALTVHPIEPFLFKVTAKGFPIMLVRPRESGSPWYVQDTMPKQGTYVQAKGRFGNANTPEGAPFRVMVAFVPRIEDVPDHGSEIKTPPEDWVLSQEVLVTLKRN